MIIREFLGLVLLVAGIMLAPLSYWISFYWAVISIAFLVLGSALFFTARAIKQSARKNDDSTPDLYPLGDLRGFNGARIFDEERDTDDL